ncbi:hypothetical protein A2U01_0083142, partial [Trifolium medium]|nr:hypothetical protein [Trifolium medium]
MSNPFVIPWACLQSHFNVVEEVSCDPAQVVHTLGDIPASQLPKPVVIGDMAQAAQSQ